MFLIADIISFLKNPYFGNQQILSRKEKYRCLSNLAMLSILVGMLFFILFIIENFILKYYGIELKQKNFGFEKGYAILIISILGPFYEELLFRLPLSFRKKDVNASLFTLIGTAGFALLSLFKDVNLNRTEVSLIKYIFIITGAGIIYLFSSFTSESLGKVKISFGKYIVWGSLIVFTLAHLTNVANFDMRLLPIYLFNLFPIFFLGTVLSFCRLRLGFFYGFLFHAAWNFLPSLLYA